MIASTIPDILEWIDTEYNIQPDTGYLTRIDTEYDIKHNTGYLARTETEYDIHPNTGYLVRPAMNNNMVSGRNPDT